jgi:diguanylate cyclase (GGDEF)-like protein
VNGRSRAGDVHLSAPNDLGAMESDLMARAQQARAVGDFGAALELYRAAAEAAPTPEARLHHVLRTVPCLSELGRHGELVEVSSGVIHEARRIGDDVSLVDALGRLADEYVRQDRWAEVALLLAECLHIAARIPREQQTFLMLNNLAIALMHAGFYDQSIDMLDRAMRHADDDFDRSLCHSNMTISYHYAAMCADNEQARQRYLHDGLYAATAALDPMVECEVGCRAHALAHRAMLLCHIGHLDAALRDAEEAGRLVADFGSPSDATIAAAADAVARWLTSRDTALLPSLREAMRMATADGIDHHLVLLAQAEVDALWALGRFDEARAVFEARERLRRDRLRAERAVQWQHVQLGMEHHVVEQLSESDPLTGLNNRRFLDHCLPEAIADEAPSCVAVVDIDRFKQVNDVHGYVAGDLVLQELAGVLERVCRRGDAVARLGGDEFVMVLRSASPGDARKVFERVRMQIASRTWKGLPSEARLTISIGMTVVAGNPALDPSDVLANAADAMRESKRAGRDQLTIR